MKISDKYLQALKAIDDWVIVSEWATKVGEMYPDILEKAEIQAVNQISDTTGLREIAARISSGISSGTYAGTVEIDNTERPRKVRFTTSEQFKEHVDAEAEEDAAPLKRVEIEKRDLGSLSTKDKYRMEELQGIAKQLKSFNGLEFELDHASALLNDKSPGRHHPDNLQFLLKAHNAKKHNKNWPRFSLDEQLTYIRTVVGLQKLVADRLNISVDNDVLEALLERLAKVYD